VRRNAQAANYILIIKTTRTARTVAMGRCAMPGAVGVLVAARLGLQRTLLDIRQATTACV